MAIITTFRVPYKLGDTIRIKPIADVHLGNTYCDIEAFKRYLDDRDEHTYFLGIGDLMDDIITKDLKRYEKHSDDSETDYIVDEQVDRMEKLLSPLAKEGRIIGLGEGNHERTISKYCGTNPIKRLCKRLDVTQLGYSGFVRLRFREKAGRGRTVMIYHHHGFGGGSRTEGADITKFARHASHFDADIYLYGHVHKLDSHPVTRMAAVGDKWIAKPRHVIICGTYLRTLSKVADPTYAEMRGYTPTTIGGAICNIKPDPDYWVKIKIDT